MGRLWVCFCRLFFFSLSLANTALLYLHSSKIVLDTVNNLRMIKAYRIYAYYSTFLIKLEHFPDTGVCKHPGNNSPVYRGAMVWSFSIVPNNGSPIDKCYLDSVPRLYSRESDIPLNTSLCAS